MRSHDNTTYAILKCFGFNKVDFTHIPQAYFSDTEVIHCLIASEATLSKKNKSQLNYNVFTAKQEAHPHCSVLLASIAIVTSGFIIIKSNTYTYLEIMLIR